MKPRFFEVARTLCKHSNHPAYKHGAVIVHKNRIISSGFNRLKTSPRSTHAFQQIHAEMDAIFKSRVDLKKCTMYITRETKDGRLAESRPCPACMEVIRASGIKKVFYSTNNGFKGEDV